MNASHPIARVRMAIERMEIVSVVHAHSLRNGDVYLRLKNRKMVNHVVDAVNKFYEIGIVSFVSVCAGD
jgi:hypothetical protein